MLRRYVGRVSGNGQGKECPIAGCTARLQRTRSVERDAALAARLAALPSEVTTVWLCARTGRLRTRPPAEPAGAPAADGRGTKRRREAGEQAAPRDRERVVITIS